MIPFDLAELKKVNNEIMKDIKFRAWNKQNSNPNERMIYPATIDNKGLVIMPDGDTWDIPVMQFTGLKDKSGKEIYEGDIVKLASPYGDDFKTCEIRFVNGGFIVEASGWFSGGEADLTTVGWAIEEDIEVEVIGNKYEHPELLTTVSNDTI